MKTNKFDKLFNTIMEEAKKPTKKAVIKESEGYDASDELEPFEGDYVPTEELIRKEAMSQLRYEDIPYSEAKMLANDIVAALCGQLFNSKSDFELNVSFEIRENLRAFYESKKVDKSKKVIKELGEGFVATREQVEQEISKILSDYDWEISLNCNMERLGKRISRKFIKEHDLNFVTRGDFLDTVYEAVYDFVYN